MATHSLSSKSPKLVAIRGQIAAYRGVLLSSTQASALLPGLRRLVLAADPSSPEDARVLLSSACRFLADVAPESGGDLAGLLTEERVACWSHVQKRAGMNEGTLRQHLVRLKRLIRVKRGLPARMRVSRAKRQVESPYRLDTLQGLVDRLGSDAAAALVAGVGAGLVVPEVVGAVFDPDGRHVVDSHGRAHPLVDVWVSAACRLAGVTVTRGGWADARSTARTEGLNLVARLLRRTWTVTVVGMPLPAVELIRTFGLTRRLVDSAQPFLLEVSEADAARLLRG